MNMFKEIKDAVSVRDAASFYGYTVGRGGMMCCPFHDDKHPSMKVDKRFHCFGCGADGDVISFVQMLFCLDAKGAALKLIDDFRLNIDTGHKKSARRMNRCTRQTQEKAYEHKVLLAYEKELEHFKEKMACISSTLLTWEHEHAPTMEQWEADMPDERFITAVNNKDPVEYILDTLTNGTDDEIYEEYRHRKEIIEKYERKITEVTERSA